MKAIVLAGGFAKRLWPLTKDTPKPLLSVGGKPIIEHIIEKLENIKELDEIFISSNQKFDNRFNEWLSSSNFSKPIQVIPEPSMSEEEKLGAVGALGFLLKEKGIREDLLVVAGDNLFDFNVEHFMAEARKGNPTIALYDMIEKEMVKEKYGVVVLDENNTIIQFHEKPADPVSTMVSTGCYFFPKHAVELIHVYLGDGENPDAPGYFISWLSKQMDVSGFVFNGDSRWFDIGCIESFQEANRIYSE